MCIGDRIRGGLRDKITKGHAIKNCFESEINMRLTSPSDLGGAPWLAVTARIIINRSMCRVRIADIIGGHDGIDASVLIKGGTINIIFLHQSLRADVPAVDGM